MSTDTEGAGAPPGWSGLPSEAALREAAGDDPGAQQILEIFLETRAAVERAARPVIWRDEALADAIKRHPGQDDLLWHAVPYLRPAPGFDFPDTELVWKGHMRELLDRAAAGEDLRPATDAEICLLCSVASLSAPLNSGAVGLYMLAWSRAFPGVDGFGGFASEVPHYQRMHGHDIATLEREARQAVARRNPGRKYPTSEVTCDGRHDGTPVLECRFIPGTLDGLPDPKGRRRPAGRRAPPRPRPAAPAPDADDGGLTLF